MQNTTMKIILTLLLLGGGLMNSSGLLDRAGAKTIDAALTRSLSAFAIARGLNAVVSAAQGTELSIEPMGVGLTLTPGQVLDPVNDLVERFSWVMLASSASLGMQKIFLSISAWPAIGWMIWLVFLCTVASVWLSVCPRTVTRGLVKASIIVFFVRFSVPAVFVLNEMTYREFLAAEYQQSTRSIEQANSELKELTSEDAASDANESSASWLDDLSAKLNVKAAVQAEIAAIREKMQKFEQIATEMTAYLLQLIVVFLLQTIVFPLLFLYLLYRAAVLLVGLELS